jgi:hypothetical protein
MNFLVELVSSIFGKLLSSFMAAWKQEALEKKASVADAAVKRLGSSEASHAMEAEMKKLATKPPNAGNINDVISEFNKGLLLLLFLFSQSCIYLGRNVYFESRRPVFPVPEKPVLETIPAEATDKQAKEVMEKNLRATILYARRLEAMIVYWNEKAIETNEKNGYVIPPP